MTQVSAWRRCTAAFAAIATLALGACSTPPAFQVSEPSARVGTVESITQDAVQNMNTTAGTIGGALIGGGLGSLIGGGTGQVVAAVVGATGGAYLGNQAAQRSQTLVWRIAVRYDDGSVASDPADVGAEPAHRRSRARHAKRDRAPALIALARMSAGTRHVVPALVEFVLILTACVRATRATRRRRHASARPITSRWMSLVPS